MFKFTPLTAISMILWIIKSLIKYAISAFNRKVTLKETEHQTRTVNTYYIGHGLFIVECAPSSFPVHAVTYLLHVAVTRYITFVNKINYCKFSLLILH